MAATRCSGILAMDMAVPKACATASTTVRYRVHCEIFFSAEFAFLL